MANLYSQYISGVQVAAGTIVGSAMGVSGLNPIVDRLNSISTNNNLIVGSVTSGTSIDIYGKLFSTISIGSITIGGHYVATGGAGGQGPAGGNMRLTGSSDCLFIHVGSFTWRGNPFFSYGVEVNGANIINYVLYKQDGLATSGAITFTQASIAHLQSGTSSRWQTYEVGTYDSVGNARSSSILYMIPLDLNVRIDGFT